MDKRNFYIDDDEDIMLEISKEMEEKFKKDLPQIKEIVKAAKKSHNLFKLLTEKNGDKIYEIIGTDENAVGECADKILVYLLTSRYKKNHDWVLGLLLCLLEDFGTNFLKMVTLSHLKEVLLRGMSISVETTTQIKAIVDKSQVLNCKQEKSSKVKVSSDSIKNKTPKTEKLTSKQEKIFKIDTSLSNKIFESHVLEQATNESKSAKKLSIKTDNLYSQRCGSSKSAGIMTRSNNCVK